MTMLSSSLLALLFPLVACAWTGTAATGSLNVGSTLGRKLLEKARRLNDNDDDGVYDLPHLYLKYLGCSSYRTADDDEDDDSMTENSLVRFTLCATQSSSTSCGDCAGEYALDMVEFLEAYSQVLKETQQQQCEYVKEHCYCSSGYWENCLYNCYASAGIVDCMDQYYGEDAEGSFQLQEYIECSEAYGGNNNNNNNNNNNYNSEVQFFVGPYCASDSQIYLGAYYDEYCSAGADSSYFMSLNYGNGFPYFYEPVLSGTDCFSCKEQNDDDNNNNGDDYYNAEANELCQMSTEEADYKCDSTRGYYNGCYFLNSTLPCMDGRGCPSDDDDQEGGDDDASSSAPSAKRYYQDMFDLTQLTKEDYIAITVLGIIALALILAVAFKCASCCCFGRDYSSSQVNNKSRSLLSKTNDNILRERSLLA